FALNDLVPSLHKAAQSIGKAKQEIVERRSKLALKAVDPADVAGAMRRQEIRTFLRQLDEKQRDAWFRDRGDTVSPEVRQAIIEMPPEVSGVPKSRHDLLTQDAWQAQHGPELTDISDRENAIETAESAVEAARVEVGRECGLDIARFNELAAPVEAKHAAPWLRWYTEDGVDKVYVVDLEAKAERPATPDEIEQGVFYRDYEDYQRGRAA